MRYMIELVPGYTNEITVKPTKTLADSSIENSLTPQQRQCRFGNEMPDNMTLFKHYSKAACDFECRVSIR